MSYFSKASLLDKAIEITKAYATSEGGVPIKTVLRQVYEELVVIDEEIPDID